jgi:hypothetical protein
MKIISINGVAVASPVSFVPQIQDVDGDSNRNQAGTMIRIVIAPDMRTFACQWKQLTQAQLSTIIRNTSSRYGHAKFSMTFINEVGEQETANFYRGAETITQVSYIANEERYNLSFNMIENDGRSFANVQ